MKSPNQYQFTWDLLGDIALGRPNLGPTTRLEVYRLMQFCFRDVLEKNFGAKKTDQIFYDSGKLAGSEFYQHILAQAENPNQPGDFNELIRRTQKALSDMGIGILRVEKADLAAGSFILTVSEDLDCSGLPELDFEICVYDEGFIAGILESFTGKSFKVKEIDCWCTGDRTCRFSAEVV